MYALLNVINYDLNKSKYHVPINHVGHVQTSTELYILQIKYQYKLYYIILNYII